MTVADDHDDDRPHDDHVAPQPEKHQLSGAQRAAPEVFELVGSRPDLPPQPERNRVLKVVPRMTADETLSHFRDRRGNPYLTLGRARALYALTLKHRSTV